MQPARCPVTVPSEIDGSTKDSFPRISRPLALGDGPETVNRSDDEDPDNERGQSTSFDVAFCDNPFKCHIGCLTIDGLSDDVLLYVFNLYRQASQHHTDWWLEDGYVRDNSDRWPWRALARVCQRWRRIIFSWPSQLGVQVECKSGTAMAKVLDVWPDLPISIRSTLDHKNPDGEDIITELKHRDRLAEIKLWRLTKSQLERCATLMQGSFPILRTLVLSLHSEIPGAPVITDGFLGGSAPRLRELRLLYVPFPTLPNLLLSATDLVDLCLDQIPSTGYISSDMMATCMSMLPRLQSLSIIFQSQESFPDLTNRRPPSPARAVLPALTTFRFKGVIEYSEDLMTRIDAPLLNYLCLEFFYRPVVDIPQVPQFINRTKQFDRLDRTEVHFEKDTLQVTIWGGHVVFILEFSSTGFHNQLSLFKHICTQFLPIFSHVDELLLLCYPIDSATSEEEPALFLEVLDIFNAVETLWIEASVMMLEMVVADAFGSMTWERAEEVLPVVHTIQVREKRPRPHIIDAIGSFIDARSEMGRPVELEWVNW